MHELRTKRARELRHVHVTHEGQITEASDPVLTERAIKEQTERFTRLTFGGG